MLRGSKSVAQRLEQYGEQARARLMPDFIRVGIAYPPNRVTLVGLKEERILQVWVAEPEGPWKNLRNYPILGASGRLGPKLEEGDGQVPEGVYHIASLNPNSLFHLSLRVDYPNDDDRRRGREDGRVKLGGDIMVHGKSCSIGCLAMGDEAAEELFVLAAETGIDRVKIILSPVDFRVRGLPMNMPHCPVWTNESYAAIQRELDAISYHPKLITPAGGGTNR